MVLRLGWLAAAVACWGCTGQVEPIHGGNALADGGEGDSGVDPDSGRGAGAGPDAGAFDGGSTDAGQTDAGPPFSVIPADRRIDWSQAGVLKPDGTLGIPDPSTGVRCASLAPSNTLADINAALARCSSSGAVGNSNQEVYLSAGTYVLSDRIQLNSTRNVTLRGAGRGTGAGATTLQFTGGYANGGVHFIGAGGADLIYGSVDPAKVLNWTAGYAQGATVITLSSVSGLSPGDVLLLDQLNDDSVPGTTPPLSAIDVSTSYTANGGTETSRAKGTRAQQQYVKIVSVDAAAGQVTISPGLFMPNWRPSQQPQAYGWNNWSQMSGVEDLTIVNAGSAQTNIEFENCYDCWVRNVESDNSNNSHVLSWETGRIEIRDSYFYMTQAAGGDSRGLFMQISSDNLIINNSFEQVTLPISLWGLSGSVVAYNFTTDMTYNTYPQILMPGLTTEAGHTSMTLFEGNYSNQISMDNNHGAGSRNTVFRNRLMGWETGRTSWTLPVVLNFLNHDMNFVGNLLGKAGYPNNFETSYANNSMPDTSVYGLGYWIYSWSYPSQYDTRVVTTLLRHGNWDAFNNAIEWDRGIADHSLPASLYLPGPPSWWGTCPWPPFDPASPTAADYLNLPAGRAWHAQFPSKTPSEIGP